jgi:type III pantothenate kinase
MRLAVDIGNTQTVIGAYRGRSLQHCWRISTDVSRTADEYRILLGGLLSKVDLPLQSAALSSVVPTAVSALRPVLSELTSGSVVVVGPGVRTGLQIRIDNPREVGADRVVNAIGAVERYGAPVLVVDFGTATTVDVIDEAGAYCGGAIAPGMQVAGDALASAASALRRVELAAPRQATGRNTTEAVQSGLVFGWAGLVDGLVRRICTEQGLSSLPVVATGGLAQLIGPVCETVTHIEDELTLRGLLVVLELNS